MLDRASATAPAVVLIVEDEPLLRELAVEFIELAGFIALEAGDAEEAVALLEARSDIAVLFTDVNMPGSVDGLGLAHTVRDRWPPIKILVASGRVRLKRSDLPPNSVFLEKPYHGETMIAELRTMLDPTRTLIGSDLPS
jgi:two-component system, response regulator PdtaR